MSLERSRPLASAVMQGILDRLFCWVIGADQAELYQQGDWDSRRDRWVNPAVQYPRYYTDVAFHGLADGYLSPIAALTYDPVTAIASPPHEDWVRRQMLAAIQGQPQTILDLGCGTGSTTLLLRQAFPHAQITGLDLSPDMLVVADHKARRSPTPIHWRQGLAEATDLPAASVDLISIAFLFHEVPPAIAQRILHESWRLLRPGGQVVILDGSQPILRRLPWLIELFREPYSNIYAAGNVETWLSQAGFTESQTQHIGLIHQLSQAHKPAIASLTHHPKG